MSNSEEKSQSPNTEPAVSQSSVQELNAQVETFRTALKNAWDAIDDLQEQLENERTERRRLADEHDALREQVHRLDARTDLLHLIETSDEMDGKQRSVVLIQSLRRAAEKERDRGRDAKASVTRNEAERALGHPDVDRTTIYDDMRRAVRLVDDEDVLAYVSGSEGDSRLKMNLEAGDLPGEIAGQRTAHGER